MLERGWRVSRKRGLTYSEIKERKPAIPPERRDPGAWYGNEGWDPSNWSGDEYVLPQWARDYIKKRKRSRSEDVEDSEE